MAAEPMARKVAGQTMPSAAAEKIRRLRMEAPETKRMAGSELEFRSRMAPRL